MSLISIIKKHVKNKLFTTPSHNGNLCLFHKFYQWYKCDISETDTHNPQEGLKLAEQSAAKIYGTKYTKFLTNGSTSGIISAVISSGAKKILVWDNSHICHYNAVKLAGGNAIEYKLPYDEDLGLYRAITSMKVEELLTNNDADAIIITSPTYEGFAADVIKMSEICKKHNAKLIVDEAHGALYPFSENLPTSAVKYADYTVQSLHKTAGGINPTALLHSNDKDPSDALKMINTTSPSYPMLATIEANIKFLNSARGKRIINQLINNIKSIKLPQYNDDVTKIILKSNKMSGYEMSELLYKYHIEDEITNEKTTMLLCGIGTDSKMLERLKKALSKIPL